MAMQVVWGGGRGLADYHCYAMRLKPGPRSHHILPDELRGDTHISHSPDLIDLQRICTIVNSFSIFIALKGGQGSVGIARS